MLGAAKCKHQGQLLKECWTYLVFILHVLEIYTVLETFLRNSSKNFEELRRKVLNLLKSKLVQK